jgi:hypothetical protein
VEGLVDSDGVGKRGGGKRSHVFFDVLGDVWDISFFAFEDLQLSVFKKKLETRESLRLVEGHHSQTVSSHHLLAIPSHEHNPKFPSQPLRA